MNKNKRVYRGACLLFLVFLLAPMEDGCKYEKAAASGAAFAPAPAVPAPAGSRLAIAERKPLHERN